MGKLICVITVAAILAGCAPLDPVGHGTAKWHGEQHLRTLTNRAHRVY